MVSARKSEKKKGTNSGEEGEGKVRNKSQQNTVARRSAAEE